MSIAVLTAIVPALVMLASVAIAPAASAGTVPPAPAGWTTVYSDNFDGAAGSSVDSSWTIDQGTQYSGTGCTGAYGTGEVDTASASTANVSEDGNGDLDITPVENPSNGQWTSGRIETVEDDFAAPAGGEMEVSATIKQPDPANGDGYWPAFWMLGAGFRASGAGTSGTMDCSNWPSVGEIDVMEDVNGLSENSSTLHCGVDPGGPCNEPDGISSGLTACSGCQTSYNTYSVIINRTDTSAESISWYLNNNPTPYLVVNEDQVPTATWQAAVDHGFFLILDVAMGGAFPDPVCGCTTPTSSTTSGASMGVSDVAVYTTNGSGGGTTAPAAPTGLTVTGTTSSSASLSWTAPSGPVSGYDVYENGTQVASGLTGTTDTITGLAASTSYSFTVDAYNSAGYSPQSSAVTATTASSGGGGSGGGTSCSTTATADISADCYSASQGSIDVTTTTDPAPSGVDGNQVAQLASGDYLEYPGVNFGSGSSQFTARVASGAAGGVSGLVEVVLDNPDNAPIGTFAVGNTGGWSSWESIPANITTTTGIHNVYLEFVSGAGGDPPFVSLHYFSFPTT
jgi:Carbohydrate binding module (family 6)/Fibronectin type III domain